MENTFFPCYLEEHDDCDDDEPGEDEEPAPLVGAEEEEAADKEGHYSAGAAFNKNIFCYFKTLCFVV